MVSFGIFHMLFSRNLLYVLKKARIKAKFSRLYLDKIPPKGSLIVECGKMLEENGYKVRCFNTVNFQKSMHYNPFKYIRSEKDIMKLVTTLIANTNDSTKTGGDPFWE